MNTPQQQRWLDAVKVASTVAQINPVLGTDKVQDIVRQVTGVELDGRTINGKKFAQVYRAGKQALRSAA